MCSVAVLAPFIMYDCSISKPFLKKTISAQSSFISGRISSNSSLERHLHGGKQYRRQLRRKSADTNSTLGRYRVVCVRFLVPLRNARTSRTIAALAGSGQRHDRTHSSGIGSSTMPRQSCVQGIMRIGPFMHVSSSIVK